MLNIVSYAVKLESKSMLEQIKNLRCNLGMHQIKWVHTWYYSDPDYSYCGRCQKKDVLSLRMRYETWSAYHTMNPFAWPWVLYESIRFYRAQKD